MSGQWNPYAKETDIESEPTEIGDSLESEPDDKQLNDAKCDRDWKHDCRFRRRID
jgi:hypothetical protein